MKSKKELYNFLLQDCQAYLPPMDATNVNFLKQIKRGTKEVRVSARKSSIIITSAGTRSWWPRCHRSRASPLIEDIAQPFKYKPLSIKCEGSHSFQRQLRLNL